MTDTPLITAIIGTKFAAKLPRILSIEVQTESGPQILSITAEAARQLLANLEGHFPTRGSQ